MLDEKRKTALEIIKKEALQRGKFILASGKESNYYIDIKKVSLKSEFLDIISDIICEILEKNFESKDIAGVELGGVPLISATLLKMRQKGFRSNGIIIRKKPKEHGTQKYIEGPEVKKVVLIEDVITTGNTTLSAIDKLKENGIDVEGVICVVDRGGAKNIKTKCISIFEIEEILK